MGQRCAAPQSVEQRNLMASDPKNAELDEKRDPQTAASRAVPAAAITRRKYAPPHLKQLGSVRDLTLGSPPGRGADGVLARKTM